jgi:hypothetical protein
MTQTEIIAAQLRDLMDQIGREMNATTDEDKLISLDDATFAIQDAIDLLESV